MSNSLVDHAVGDDEAGVVTARCEQRVGLVEVYATYSRAVQSQCLVRLGGQVQVEPQGFAVVRADQ